MSLAELRSDRLVLRELRAGDAAAMYEIFSDEQTMRYWSCAPHRSLDESRAYVQENVANPALLTWAITLDGAAALGWVVLVDMGAAEYELGYILHRRFWARGFAREAVCSLLNHGFGPLAARKIRADVDADNLPSLKLLESLGFRRERLQREAFQSHIGLRDSVIYTLSAEDWRQPVRS